MPTIVVESHTHSVQYSSDGTSWTDISDYIERIATRHGYQADRGTCELSCYVYPSGLAENDYVLVTIDGVTVFSGRMARPQLHGVGASVAIQCEGRGAYLAKAWKADGTDPELDDLFNRVYTNQTDGDIITNLAEAASVEVSMHSIQDSGVVRGTLEDVVLRPGQTFWSLIRGDGGLDELVGYWTAEDRRGVIVRAPIAYAGSPDITVTEGDNLISGDRTPLGTESIFNRCIVYGLETFGFTFGGLGIGDYSLPNTNIDGYNPKTIRSNLVESDADALASATNWVLRHNFPEDNTNVVLLGDPTITIGQTGLLDAPTMLDHNSDTRFVAEVSQDYGVGVGFETKVHFIRVEI